MTRSSDSGWFWNTRRPIVIVMAATMVAMLAAGRVAIEDQRSEFVAKTEVRARELVRSFESRLQDFASVAYTSRGLFAASERVEYAEWVLFVGVASENIRASVGASGFSVAQRVPAVEVESFVREVRQEIPDFEVRDVAGAVAGPRADLWVVRFDAADSAINGVRGLNLASDPSSRAAIELAVKTGRIALSAPASGSTATALGGTVLYLPIFPRGAGGRRSATGDQPAWGCVALPIDLQQVVRLLHGGDLDVIMSDGAAESVAYAARATVDGALGAPVNETAAFGGRKWRFTVRLPAPKLADYAGQIVTRCGLIGVFGFLLAIVVWLTSRTGARAAGMAKEMTRELRRVQERFALCVAGSRDGHWDWDLVTGQATYEPRWSELLGITGDCAPTQDTFFDHVAPEHVAQFRSSLQQHIVGETAYFDEEVLMVHADGSRHWMLCRAAAVRDENKLAQRLAGSMADITELKRAQEDLRDWAIRDRLTGLPNRELFTDRLRSAIARRIRRPEYIFAVLFFDFDRFKVINDSLGHTVGDALLKSVAVRLLENIREVDTAARFGGDEFLILLDGLRSPAETIEISERLLQACSVAHQLDGHDVVCTASIGIVDSERGYTSAEDMIRDADAAMYQAKANGKGRYCIFDQRLHAQAMDRLKLEEELRTVNLEEHFELLYQPIMRLRDNRIAGFEALIRWNHPVRGVISPNLFIPIAEETGLIIDLGEWVLRQACTQLVKWKKDLDPDHPLSINVNVSRRQLVHPDLVGQIEAVMRSTGIRPSDLKLEITETTVMDERHDMIPALLALKETGALLAMDDFGTGHSSLSCLHRFPIDVLKIDRGFITGVEERRELTAVIHAITSLAYDLGLDVVAEGVERDSQLAQLQAMDCGYVQGFLFAKPMSVAAATEYLMEREGAPV